MVVLSIIGIIIALIVVALLVQFANEYSQSKYRYEIFNIKNFVFSVGAYFALYFGNNWYQEALTANGDILNGIIVMFIGLIVFCIVVYINIKSTSLYYGAIMSIVTEIFYAIAAPIIFFAIVIAVAFFAQTKPVYNIND